ncbi:MAG: phosphohexomutase domain-containing protein [bacterium]
MNNFKFYNTSKIIKDDCIKINFGTDGFRGVIAESFNFDKINVISAALGIYLLKKNRSDNNIDNIKNNIYKNIEKNSSLNKNNYLNSLNNIKNITKENTTNANIIDDYNIGEFDGVKLPPAAIAIGYDTRFLSKEFALSCAENLIQMGFNVLLSDSFCPSPVLSYAVKNNLCECGVMITASHNPFKYNGIKFKNNYGGSMLESDVKEIEKIANDILLNKKLNQNNNLNSLNLNDLKNKPNKLENDLNKSLDKSLNNDSLNNSESSLVSSIEVSSIDIHYINNANPKSGELIKTDFKKNYLDHLIKIIDIENISSPIFKNMEIIIDPMYGAGIGYLSSVLKKFSIKHKNINSTINPNFPKINPEPIELNLKKLSAAVRKIGKNNKFAVGFATDGDADRIGAVDYKGNFIDSHKIFSILLNYLLEEGFKGEVVKTVSVSKTIDYLCNKYNIKLHEVSIGFKNIANLMINPDNNILIGGEESGGIGIRFHIPERDGVFNSLMLLKIILIRKKNLNELLDDIYGKVYPLEYKRYDIHIDNDIKKKLIENLKNNSFNVPFKKEVAAVNFIDGYKFEYADNSWLLIRPSGTEPILRIYAESYEKEKTQLLIEKTINEINKI